MADAEKGDINDILYRLDHHTLEEKTIPKTFRRWVILKYGYLNHPILFFKKT